MPTEPTVRGPALIVGDNPLADAWQHWFGARGHRTRRVAGAERLDETLDAIWQTEFTPHLILTTPHDEEAVWTTTDPSTLGRRFPDGIEAVYRVAQRWMQSAIDRGVMDHCSLIANVRGGGRLGFDAIGDIAPEDSRPLGLSQWSAETGGVAGLTKAMLIESWMRGFRQTPMLIVDAPVRATPASIVRGAAAEWAVPSHDEEVAVDGDRRWTTRAVYRPIAPETGDWSVGNNITRGGTWLVAGGGRGITAHVTLQLARRHGLRLHLLGMAPPPSIDDETRRWAAEDLIGLRRETYRRVQSDGGNAVKHWRQFEKAIEIDRTLTLCRQSGIEADYHSVQIEDAAAVRKLVDQIRDDGGCIRGVIQGAGSGQDARFDRKRPSKVRQCLSAKIHGTASLAAATMNDPLDWFVGFGSISGRFGANGHTDYSAANDMMAKMISRLHDERRQTGGRTARCTTFHWHAWGDIGMATKPEAKLALDMIGMDFMPAAEGTEHFLNELEFGGEDREVLITDRRYIRKFYPAEAIAAGWRPGDPDGPMIGTLRSGVGADHNRIAVNLRPAAETFLSQHTVGGRPTLPIAIAIEMMLESAVANRRLAGQDDRATAIIDVVATAALKFADDCEVTVNVLTDNESADQTAVRLVADLRRSDGRIVQRDREHFRGRVCCDPVTTVPDVLNWRVDDVDWTGVVYAGPDAPVHHGESLRCLRGYTIVDAGRTLRGVVIAPSPMEIGGDDRPIGGWQTSPAVVDAVLYAAGTLVHMQTGRASLPVRIGQMDLGRLPDCGEPLRVEVTMSDDVSATDDQVTLSATLVGQNGDAIVRLSNYVVGLLRIAS